METKRATDLKQGDTFRSEGKWEEALQCYRKAVELEPENWLAHHHIGDCLLNLEKFKEAEITYRHALKYKSDFTWTHHNLGIVLGSLRKWDEAFKCFTKVTELHPEFWEVNQINCRVHQNLGDYLFEQQRWDDAIVAYRWLIELQPHSAWGHINLGRTLQESGQSDEAVITLHHAVDIAPEISWGYYHLGEVLSKQGKYIQAIETYYLALSHHPRETQFYIALGEAQAAVEDFTGQIDTYKKLISDHPNQDISIYLSLAYSLRQAERLEEAVDVYESTAKEYPEFWLIYYYLGEIFHSLCDWEPAAKNLEKAVSLQPEFFDAYVLWGDALTNLGKIHEAIQAYEKARQINPKPNLISKIEELSQGLSQSHFDEIYTTDKMLSNLSKEDMIFTNLDDSIFVKQIFQDLLGRQPSHSELSTFLENHENGSLTRASTLEQIIKSEEFLAKGNNQNILFSEMNNEEFVEYLYQTFLKRPAEPEGIIGNCNALEQGASRIGILESFLKSEEFLGLEKQSFAERISNHQFLHTIWEIILGGPCDSHSEKHYLSCLDNGLSRRGLVLEVMKTDTFQQRVELFDSVEKNKSNPMQSNGSKNSASILGTGQFIDQDEWNNILLGVLLEQTSIDNKYINSNYENSFDNVNHKKSNYFKQQIKNESLPLVSIITSLYKGGDYINNFMNNITSQSIFKECELIIVDANSPEEEYKVIQKYMDKFDNIRYTRTDEIIGIYDAWNLGVQKSRGKFLTNANLDDLRRFDSLEKQAISLIEHEDIDVAYQDFYYTFTPNLPFEVIEKCNVKSKLPILTKANMLQFNSPHNAPMWRKNLHDKIGLFNTQYKSAGDYEFWLRALLHGSRFFKIEEPLVAYYNNPFGISTRSQTTGVSEAIEIQRIYLKLFGHSFFSMPKNDFIDFCRVNLGLTTIASPDKWQGKEVFLYHCFQQKLKEIASCKLYVSLTDEHNEG